MIHKRVDSITVGQSERFLSNNKTLKKLHHGWNTKTSNFNERHPETEEFYVFSTHFSSLFSLFVFLISGSLFSNAFIFGELWLLMLTFAVLQWVRKVYNCFFRVVNRLAGAFNFHNVLTQSLVASSFHSSRKTQIGFLWTGWHYRRPRSVTTFAIVLKVRLFSAPPSTYIAIATVAVNTNYACLKSFYERYCVDIPTIIIQITSQ